MSFQETSSGLPILDGVGAVLVASRQVVSEQPKGVKLTSSKS
jgi:hypothetical protein